MARTGDKEGEGQETQEGSRRLISRPPNPQARFNILPLLSTCTLYFACTHAICRSVFHLRWTGVLLFPNAVFFSHLHRSPHSTIAVMDPKLGNKMRISLWWTPSDHSNRPRVQTADLSPHSLNPACSSLHWGSDDDTIRSLEGLHRGSGSLRICVLGLLRPGVPLACGRPLRIGSYFARTSDPKSQCVLGSPAGKDFAELDTPVVPRLPIEPTLKNGVCLNVWYKLRIFSDLLPPQSCPLPSGRKKKTIAGKVSPHMSPLDSYNQTMEDNFSLLFEVFLSLRLAKDPGT